MVDKPWYGTETSVRRTWRWIIAVALLCGVLQLLGIFLVFRGLEMHVRLSLWFYLLVVATFSPVIIGIRFLRALCKVADESPPNSKVRQLAFTAVLDFLGKAFIALLIAYRFAISCSPLREVIFR